MNYSNWKTILGTALFCAGGMMAGNLYATAGYDLDDFRLRTAQDLVDVCTLEPGHEHHEVAMAFCYGFFEGATHYDDALGESGMHPDLVCEPDNVTRSQAVTAVVDYLSANPQYTNEPPIDAAFRALMDKWPCPE
jgi:hypothetical protein